MKHTLFVFLAATALAATGCGSQWMISQAKFYKYQNHDVRVSAKVALTGKPAPRNGDGGVDLQMRLYTGNYGTILTEETQTVGASLESAGTVDTPEVDTIAISDFRLGGTPNTYQDFCAEIKMERSNVDDWRRIGCINYNDIPSESPTGGVESM